MKPPMDPQLIEKIKARDRFANAQPKVLTRNNNNSRLDEIRERIRKQSEQNTQAFLQQPYLKPGQKKPEGAIPLKEEDNVTGYEFLQALCHNYRQEAHAQNAEGKKNLKRPQSSVFGGVGREGS
jgi:hypothetical protein